VSNNANPEDVGGVLLGQRHLAWMMPLAFSGLMAVASTVWFFSGDHAASAELSRRVTVLEQERVDDTRALQEMALRLARMEPVLDLIKEKLVPSR
jgi:hypothetical protein